MAYRTDAGSAVVEWPSTPDPVDPDAYEVSLDPNMMVIAARDEARQRRAGWWLAGFVVAFLAMCVVAGFALAQQPGVAPVPAPKPRAEAQPLMPVLCPGGVPPKPRQDLVKHLGDKFAEAPVAVGILVSGFLLEIYASPDGDTWSAVSTAPGGMACIVAAGRRWEALPPVKLDSTA